MMGVRLREEALLNSHRSRQCEIAPQKKGGMIEHPPPKDQWMPFITGGDWSVGLNSTTSLDQVLLYDLGAELRRDLSELLTMLVKQLEKGAVGQSTG
jgi:hypothetical protein